VLAAGTNRPPVLHWTPAGQILAEIPLNISNRDFLSISITSDARWAALGTTSGRVYLCNLKNSGAPPAELDGQTGRVQALAFSPDGKWLASVSAEKRVVLWNLQDHNHPGRILGQHEDQVTAVAFSKQARYLASAGRGRKVRAWEVISGRPIGEPLAAHDDVVMSVAFSLDENYLASGGKDSKIILWDLKRLDREPSVLFGHQGDVTSLVFESTGKYLASGSRDRTIGIWNVHEHRQILLLRDYETGIRSLSLADQGTLIAGDDDGTVRVWNISDERDEVLSLDNDLRPVSGVAFTFDGRYLASASLDGHIVLRNAHRLTDPPIQLTPTSSRYVWLEASPTDLHLVSGSDDGEVAIWDVATGTKEDIRHILCRSR
jgi:WD40 repeat protein